MKASFFKTSFKVVGVASSTPRCMPKLEPVTLPSITKTFFPFCANAAPKLETKVVLPVPPLPEITEIMEGIKYTLLQRHYIDSQKDNANKYKHSKSLYCKGVKKWQKDFLSKFGLLLQTHLFLAKVLMIWQDMEYAN